jgi:hypothetical protein
VATPSARPSWQFPSCARWPATFLPLTCPLRRWAAAIPSLLQVSEPIIRLNPPNLCALYLFVGYSQGKWDRKALTGIEMHGKTLGVIGCGRIGQEVAKCAKELGMQVIGYDPVMSAAAFAEAGLQQVELSDIWRQSDFITVHTPLTAETKGLLNAETLMQCKKGALTQFSPHPEMAVT